MAVVGLRNAPVTESSIIREPQSLLGRVNRDSIGTRAFSILQMWRELEDECAVNRARETRKPRLDRQGSSSLSSFQGGNVRNGLEDLSDSESQSVMSPTSVQSPDFEEMDRKRVRKVFREWMVSGGNADQRSGEDVLDKVRVVRDWIQTTSQRREASSWRTEDKVVNSRRQFRKLCGRQALLDLLVKNEKERQEELRCLEGIRPVSGFAHRTRIQAFLRLRCYQIRWSTDSRKPSAAADCELGLLRQRQTVSALREGFLSRLDRSPSTQASYSPDDFSSDNDSNTSSDDRSQVTSVDRVLDSPHELKSLSNEVFDVAHEGNDLKGNVDVDPSTAPSSLSHGPDSSTNSDQLDAELETELNHDMDDRDDDYVHNELFDQIDVSENFNSPVSSVPGDDVSGYGSEQENAFPNQWEDGRAEEQHDMQGNYWYEDNSLETTPRDWLGMASVSRTRYDRVDASHFSDDNNLRHVELRELVDRKRVSSLLHSDFSQRLEHLIQTYVDRQMNTDDDWELDEMCPPFASGIQELHVDQESEADDTRLSESETALPPPTPPPLPQAYWGQGTDYTNWSSREMHQHSDTERDNIINLRTDIAEIEQRLDDMQRMLEACMDMQLELQRSVRQELSAALNRPVNPSVSLENTPSKDSFEWDCVRKGVCCVCSNTKIDALLYRCGHMCTCTKCADVLVKDHGKCPMCQAPVTEVIRAFFLHTRN